MKIPRSAVIPRAFCNKKTSTECLVTVLVSYVICESCIHTYKNIYNFLLNLTLLVCQHLCKFSTETVDFILQDLKQQHFYLQNLLFGKIVHAEVSNYCHQSNSFESSLFASHLQLGVTCWSKNILSRLRPLLWDHRHWGRSACGVLLSLWKINNLSLLTIKTTPITPAHSDRLRKCPDMHVLAPGTPWGKALDSRGIFHPAILSIWERINFQKPWIGGSPHHMRLSLPFSLQPPQWLSGLLSSISRYCQALENVWLYRASADPKDSFMSHLRVYRIIRTFYCALIYSLVAIGHF